jgi:hypothetical protein
MPPKIDCPFTNDELRNMYIDAGSKEALCKLIGVSQIVIRRWIREAGIELNNGWISGKKRKTSDPTKKETRKCANPECGRKITRYSSRFITPPDRTFCSKSCSLKYWRDWYGQDYINKSRR